MSKGFPSSLFREYDIRGKANSTDAPITPHFALTLAQAFTSMLNDVLAADDKRPIIVGCDVRLTSPALTQAVIEGITSYGRDVINIGMVPTPLVYFSVFQLDAAGCMMITASHNPSCDNGFKMMKVRESLHGNNIQQLRQRMLHLPASPMHRGSVQQHAMHTHYIQYLTKHAQPIKPYTVVIDAGNGPAGMLAVPLLESLGCKVIPLYCEPDGRFPHHHPDPSKIENLRDLMAKVQQTGADIGFAFDGDGDRIAVVDHHGKPVWNDMLLLMLARHLLQSHVGATIISEVKSSGRMYQAIRQAGGKAIMWRTGHSPIKAKMKETGALLAGEMSGHIFFADRYFGFDDACYAMLRILEMLSDTQCKLPELIADIPDAYSTPEIRIPCPDKDKFVIVENAKQYFQQQGFRIIDVDGMRIEFEHGWGLLRASNTQACLMLRFEAESSKELAKIHDIFASWLSQNTTIALP